MKMNNEKAQITKVMAREILDSRGNPTVEVEVSLACGVRGWLGRLCLSQSPQSHRVS